MIQLEINGTSHTIEAGSIQELRFAIQQHIPEGQVSCGIQINGIEIAEDRLDDFSTQSIRTVVVLTGRPADLAHESLGETQEWIGQICDVLDSIADDFRLGRDKSATGRLVTVADALQVLVSLLDGIHECIELDPAERAALEGSWKPAQEELQLSMQALVDDLESGDPVRLADRTGHQLPRSLTRFRDLLAEIRA